MSGEKIKKYSNDDITILWNASLCTHSGKCVRGLPDVFKPKERPWINMTAATSEDLVSQVNLCPSGALSIEGHPTSKDEAVEPVIENALKVDVVSCGPLLIHGDVQVTDTDGTTVKKTKMTAFCRCGSSKNKPYCDGNHKSIGFTDE